MKSWSKKRSKTIYIYIFIYKLIAWLSTTPKTEFSPWIPLQIHPTIKSNKIIQLLGGFAGTLFRTSGKPESQAEGKPLHSLIPLPHSPASSLAKANLLQKENSAVLLPLYTPRWKRGGTKGRRWLPISAQRILLPPLLLPPGSLNVFLEDKVPVSLISYFLRSCLWN